MSRWLRHAPWLAALLSIAAIAVKAAGWEGYSHLRHPVALLGASGAPGSDWFNVLAFILPGLLLAGAGIAWRARLDAAGWPPRIGATLVVFSALAFAAQGVVLLDPEHLDSGDSRYHAAAWTLWWVSFVPGAALLAGGARPRWLHVTAAIAVPVLALVAPALIGPALAQRLAFAAWFGWWLLALRRPRRE